MKPEPAPPRRLVVVRPEERRLSKRVARKLLTLAVSRYQPKPRKYR